MNTGIRIYPQVKGGSKSRKERRERVALKRKVNALKKKVDAIPDALTKGDTAAVGIGTIRALERKISEKDARIDALQKALIDVAENLTTKGKKDLPEKTKVLLRMQ